MRQARRDPVFEYIPRDQLEQIRRTYTAATGLPSNVFNCPLGGDDWQTGWVDVSRMRRILSEQAMPEFCALAHRLTAPRRRAGSPYPPRTCTECDSFWATVVIRYRNDPDRARAEVSRLHSLDARGANLAANGLLHIHRNPDAPYIAYVCHAGLVDLVAPIYISTQPMALIYGGQWRREGPPTAPTLRRLEKLAKKINQPASEVVSAYFAVPQISDRKLGQAARHLGEIAHMLSEIGHRTQHLKRIGTSAAAIAASTDAQATYDRIMEAARDVSGCERATLWAVSPGSDRLVRLATRGTMATLPPERKLGESAAGWVARYRRPLQVDDVDDPWWTHRPRSARHPKWRNLKVTRFGEGMRSEYAVPCIADRELVGVLSVKRREAGLFSPRVRESLELLSSHVAVAIRNVRSREALRKALDTQQRFLRLASHQLITPTGSIQMAGEALQDWDDLSAEGLRELREMGHEIHTLAHVAVARTRDLLAVAEKPGIAPKLRARWTSVAALVAQAAHLVGLLAKEKNVEVRCTGLDGLPPVQVDREKMADLAIRNAVENAIRYSPRNGRVDVTGYQAGSGALRLVVRDHGRGMSPRVLGHAFDEFYRGDESGGLGLGLPAMKYVMEAHAGRAWLESRPRRGTKVVLEIPRERVAGG